MSVNKPSIVPCQEDLKLGRMLHVLITASWLQRQGSHWIKANNLPIGSEVCLFFFLIELTLNRCDEESHSCIGFFNLSQCFSSWHSCQNLFLNGLLCAQYIALPSKYCVRIWTST